MKRSAPHIIQNPWIKKRNLQWDISSPPDPRTEQASPSPQDPSKAHSPVPQIPSQAGEPQAGEPQDNSQEHPISTRITTITTALSSHTLNPYPSSTPHLPPSSLASLLQECMYPEGAHFVIHQHDHPIAGLHYDLRLQINETSSASWAIMYGMPGDPNSGRLTRNATETTVHSLWSHLTESATKSSGSTLIWDTGTYTILPHNKHIPKIDPSSPIHRRSPSSSPPYSPSPPNQDPNAPTQQQKLHHAFQDRKIRIQLHGTRLPDPYVLNLRRPHSSPDHRPRQRRTKVQSPETGSENISNDKGEQESRARISATNAYDGSTNTIGSVAQRTWYISLDRDASGFTPTHRPGRAPLWVPSDSAADGGMGRGPHVEVSLSRLSFPFYVRGTEHERSVVTGRLSEDVIRDCGVTDFRPRKGWRPVLN